MSTSILLLFLVFVGDAADTTIDPATESPTTIPTVAPTVAPPTVAPPTASPTVPPTAAPTTKVPEITTTINPNIKMIEEADRNQFVTNMNGHRNVHLIGRYAYAWTWDPALVDSAISRVVDSCDPKIDNSDEVHELGLNADDWRYIRRDKKTLNRKVSEVTYESGIARVGCVGRINCKDSPLGDPFYFCHFATSNFTKDANFKNGHQGKCEHHGTYTNLCQDVPEKAPEYVTVLPARIIYRDRAAAQFSVLLGMIAVFSVYGVWN